MIGFDFFLDQYGIFLSIIFVFIGLMSLIYGLATVREKGHRLEFYLMLLLIIGSVAFSVVFDLRSGDTVTSAFLGKQPDNAYDMKFFLPLNVGYEKARFVKVTIAVELMDKGFKKELDNNISKLRKEVIDLILTKSPKEVKSSEGKKELRREITTRLNDYLLKDCIKDTYFTEMVIL